MATSGYEQKVNFNPPPALAHAPSPGISRAFEAILAPLLILIAARFRRLGPQTIPLWAMINRARQHITRLLTQIAVAQPPRAPRPREAQASPRATRLPRQDSWLLYALRHEAAEFKIQLETLLSDPGTAAALAARPTAIRSLRPICRLLGVTLPIALQPPQPHTQPELPPLPEPTPARRPAIEPEPPRRLAPPWSLLPLCTRRAFKPA